MKIMAGRWLRWSLVIIASMILCLSIALYLLEDPVLEKVLQKINARSDYRIETEDGSLTLFRSFPRLGIRFEEAEISVRDRKPFLRAGEIVLYADLFRLLGGEYELQSFRLGNASLHLTEYADGTNNFETGQTAENTSDPFSLRWKNARLEQVTIDYKDESNGQVYKFAVGEGRLDGRLTGTSLELDAGLVGRIVELTPDRDWRWSDLPFQLQGSYRWAFDRNEQDFDISTLVLGNTRWSVAGIVREGPDGLYDFRCTTEGIPLQEVHPLLPPDWKEALEGMEFGGLCRNELHIYGPLDGTDSEPSVEIDFSVESGRYASAQVPGSMTALSGRGHYSYIPGRKARLDCASVKGNWNGAPFTGSFRLDHLRKTVISGRLDEAVLPLIALREWMTDSAWVIDQGTIRISDAAWKNLVIGDTHGPDWTGMTARIAGSNLKGLYKDSSWQIKDIALEWGPDSIRLHHASGILLGDRWQARGRIAMPASLRLKTGAFVPKGQAELYFDRLTLDRWIGWFGGERGPAWEPVALRESSSEAWYRSLPGARMDIRTEIGTLRYGEIRCSQLNCNARWRDRRTAFDATFHTASGSMDLNGSLRFDAPPRLHLEAALESIDIHELFDEWGDFGQELVRHKQVRGEMDGRVLMNARWQQDGRFDYDNLEVISGLQVYDGELIGLELLEDFSSYIDIDELRHIRFQTLQNILILRNGAVYIPAMFIQSNAANLTVNGVHRLNHTMDYNIKLNAGQVLTRRIAKGKNTEVVPAKRNGWFNMYYSLYGHPDRLDYKTDRNKVTASFKQCEIIREKARERLIEHFGNVPLFEEPVDWEAIPEYEGVEGDKPVYLDNF